MSKYLRFFILCLASCFSFDSVYAQAPSKPLDVKPDYSAEAFVAEQDSTRIVFENDGTYRRESTARIRIQSGAGVQRYGVLTFPYQNSTEGVDIEYVRVRKPDGTVVATPPDNVQDMAAEVTRQAPLYSDLREKHVAVKGLVVGDVLEFQSLWHSTKPLASGQFWFAYNFSRDAIILQEQLQISVPGDRQVKWKSPNSKPVITKEGARRVFTWTSSQLEHKSSEEEKKEQERTSYQAARGKLPPPEVQISSFQSWEEVGRWYDSLQRERTKPTAEIRAKATGLTKDSADDNAKLHAIYSYVSTQFRYIGIDFGIGRYQPHSATEVLSNQYGDCKDKHTLLASLLAAVDIKAYPALISSAREIDLDVPSPAQFDHVISVISRADHFTWLDTTPEVAPFEYLRSALRDKQALVITADKSPTLMTTPSDPPSKAMQTFRIDGKLNDTGTLEGKIERTIQGDDNEVLLRIAFRSVPLPQWKDLIQRISYSSGFAGDVSEVIASSPEKIDEPFRFAYNYTRKDYPDWSSRRINSPLPPIALPSLEDKDSKPSHPIWLGSPTEAQLESHVELPKGYTPELPRDVDIKEDFAEYHASYSTKDDVLTTDRRFVVKLREVPVGEYGAYKKFSKAVGDDHELYIALSSGRSPATSYQDAIWTLPYSDNPGAARAYDEARDKFQRQDVPGEIASLTRAVEIDPKFTRAWLWLGEIYKFSGQIDNALQSYRKAIDVDPQQPVAYKALGFTLLGMRKFEDAILVWEELIKVAPNDGAGPAGLGSTMFSLKRYQEAVSAFEAAVKLNPQFPGLFMQLGSASLLAGDDDKALVAFRKALALDPRPVMFNDIAYALADADKKLAMALEYAQKAVSDEEEASQKIKLSELKVEDLGHTASLAPYWDTLGWVHFRMGNFDQAEKYLTSAWTLSLGAFEADHLGQVYEHQHKKLAAIHMYRVAVYCFPQQVFRGRGTGEIEKTRERLERLSPGSSMPSTKYADISEEVNLIRTVKLARLVPGTANADFFLVLARNPKNSSAMVEDVKFISGSETLKFAGKALMSAAFKGTFPADGHPRMLRRGTLGCYEHSGCSVTLFLPNDVHALN
jgi:tetratricopeptide (TPR) repeat protein/transglutaminase-like putative cysteine protease